ncbi:PF20097 family protein [Alloiococcus sp. CFN-8]|uniref:PF20097 family protein n=1 Tax=Alloiococcus sp. CFN-8 TaxID=3416081 RepID=UPI003CF9E611
MKCPYCDKDMKLGQIKADNVLAWTPDGESVIGFTRWARSRNSILLARWYGFSDASLNAYYCDTCNKIVIDVPKQRK